MVLVRPSLLYLAPPNSGKELPGTEISAKGSKEVVIMRNHAIGCRAAQCECGALVRNGSAWCEKCSARHRWMRRKAWRKYSGD